MIFKIISIAVMPIFVFCANITIRTTDTGGRYSTITPDIAKYYTQLSSFGIVPTPERSLIFNVKACAYAYVLFASTDDITKSKDFYEFVTGGTHNSKNRIRRRYKDGTNTNIKEVSSRSLRCDKYRRFYINWSNDGYIQFGGKDQSEGYEIRDSQPIQIRAFGIRTAYGNNGSWIFEMKDNESVCECPCGSIPKSEFVLGQNLTRDEMVVQLSSKIEAIKNELKINKYNLSMNRRRRTSASDDRKSARRIGIVGVIVLSVVFGLIVLIDVFNFKRIIR